MSRVLLALALGVVLAVAAPDRFVSSASAAESSPRIVNMPSTAWVTARREEIRAMPLLERPNRPGHFYGNNVRRLYYGKWNGNGKAAW